MFRYFLSRSHNCFVCFFVFVFCCVCMFVSFSFLLLLSYVYADGEFQISTTQYVEVTILFKDKTPHRLICFEDFKEELATLRPLKAEMASLI